MKLVAIFYTNNKPHPKLLQSTIRSVEHAADYCNLGVRHEVTLALSAWAPLPLSLPKWKTVQISHYTNQGHLNIILQLLQVLQAHPDVEGVVLCEHDVLYVPNYFEAVGDGLAKGNEYTLNLNYVGLNNTGYVKQNSPPQIALSQVGAMRTSLINLLLAHVCTCAKQGWCFMEPGYQTGDKSVYHEITEKMGAPNVHVNMHQTQHNHHFTTHHSTYSTETVENVPWWGDYRTLLPLYESPEAK